jgi:hypothetical protein
MSPLAAHGNFRHPAPVSSTAADRPGHHDEQLLLQESCVRSWEEK